MVAFSYKGRRAADRVHAHLIWIRVKLTFAELKHLVRMACTKSKEYTPTNTRWDWSEPVLARYPAVDQTSYHYGAS